MSALGQKQTCAVQKGMSALPPIADMCSATDDVRFVPIADIDELIRTNRKTAWRRSLHGTIAYSSGRVFHQTSKARAPINNATTSPVGTKLSLRVNMHQNIHPATVTMNVPA